MRTVSVFACVLLCTAHVDAAPAEDALAAYDKFFAAFTTDNYEQITTFFAPDAQFYGTNSPEVVTNREGIRTYFMRALDGARGTTKATQFDRTAVALTDTVVRSPANGSRNGRKGHHDYGRPIAQHRRDAQAWRSLVDRPVPQLADTEGTRSDVLRSVEMMVLPAGGVPTDIRAVYGNRS